MSYSIDYTAEVYAARRAWRIILRFFALMMIVGVCWGVHWVYMGYMKPTLSERLMEYHRYAQALEDYREKIDTLSKEYECLVPYYQVRSSESVTNVTPVLTKWNFEAPNGIVPVEWTLQTGKNCTLKYKVVLSDAEKTLQLKNAREWFHSVSNALGLTSVSVTDSVKGGDLAQLKEVDFTVTFALRDGLKAKDTLLSVPKPTPAFEAKLKSVNEFRMRLHGTKLGRDADNRELTLEILLMDEVMRNPAAANRKQYWSDAQKKVLSPELFWAERDREVLLPSTEKESRSAWTRVSEARFFWNRNRDLDNDALVADIRSLEKLAMKAHLGEAYQVLVARLDELRYPLSCGFTYDDIFNEHVGAQRVASLFHPFEASVKFDHGKVAPIKVSARKVVTDGEEAEASEEGASKENVVLEEKEVFLTPWTVLFEPAGGRLEEVGDVVETVASAMWGLLPEKLEISFRENRPETVKVSGCFPVSK